MEDIHTVRGVSPERLASQVGPQGCLLHCPSPSQSSEVHAVHSEAGSLSVHLPSIWSILFSMGIHKSALPCCSLSPYSGSSDDRLHR